MKDKVLPIKPSEVVKAKEDYIPPQIFEAFNELIVEYWDTKQSRIKQEEVIERSMEKFIKAYRFKARQ